MSTNVVWYKSTDLRLEDHAPLVQAHGRQHGQGVESVVHLYVFDPYWFGRSRIAKFPKTGIMRAKFLLETVADLRRNLEKEGQTLVVRVGKSANVISDLCGELEVRSVFTHQEIASEELAIEAQVREACDKNGVQFKTEWGNTLYQSSDLPFGLKNIPNTFTQFRKQVESRSQVHAPVPTPQAYKPLPKGCPDKGRMPTLKQLGFGDEEVAEDRRAVLPFRGGENAAWERLNHYIWGDHNALAKYKETRNGMIGADYSSKFAPWLATGALSARSIYAEVKQYEEERTKNKSTFAGGLRSGPGRWSEATLAETFPDKRHGVDIGVEHHCHHLIIRDWFYYYMGMLGDSMFKLEGPRNVRDIKWSQDPAAVNAWVNGETGYPFIDANMRELAQSGFQSNRGRQNVCSFLTKDMGVDWRIGAEYFESILLDYDVASNWGNWTYGAGVGADPREGRYFNIHKQGKNYDGDGAYVRLWCPELKGIRGYKAHKPWENNQGQAIIESGRYPKRVCELRGFSQVGGGGRSGGGRGKRRGGQQGSRGFHSGGRGKRSRY